MSKKRVVLIDGTAMIFRAFFAIPSNFSTKDGLPTNAIYGFTMMFRKLLQGRTPDYGAVIFDAPGRTFRDEKFPEYKAQRSGMAPELVQQLDWIDRVVGLHNFPILKVPGYEADDVIGTLTRQAREQGMEVIIVSGDKDFAQLIDEDTKMLDAIRDITYDAELVRKKWGVPPRQFVDFLALMGDKIDNIPGVPGIGKKGAAQLLANYSSLDGILDNTESLKGRQKKNLEEFRDQALLSRELALIDVQVPLDTSLDDLAYTAPKTEDLNELYRTLEFFSLLTEAERDLSAAEDQGDVDYHVVESVEDLEARLGSLSNVDPAGVQVLYDLPYVTRGDWVGVAIASAAKTAFYVPLRGEGAVLPDSAMGVLKKYFEDPERPKVAHNVKQLIILLERYAIQLAGVAGDTMLGSFLIDPGGIIPHRLDQCVKQYLQRTIRNVKSVIGAGKKQKLFSALAVEDVGVYACHLADAIVECWPVVETQLEDQGQTRQLFEHDIPLSAVLARMEIRGTKVDADDLKAIGEEFADRLQGYERTIHEMAGRSFNVQSTKQLGKVLFDELGLPVIKRTKSGYSTNAEVLERLAPKHDIAKVILDYRKLAKLINTYTDVLQRELNPDTGRIHANFQQTVGVSGRLISTDPDLQRTPIRTSEGKRIRAAFVTEPGHQIVSADWSQIELRVLAHFTKDPKLTEAFEKKWDVHARTASELFHVGLDEVTSEQRNIGKTINFATVYGQGATALGQILSIPRKEAKAYIDGYFEKYGRVRDWRDETIAKAHESGEVRTILGRRRVISELSSNSFMTRQAGERMAVNTPIQGSAADICKLAMLAIDGEIRDRSMQACMLMQIHDELVFECPEAEVDDVVELVRRHMETVISLEVPLVVDVGTGPTWAEAH